MRYAQNLKNYAVVKGQTSKALKVCQSKTNTHFELTPFGIVRKLESLGSHVIMITNLLGLLAGCSVLPWYRYIELLA